MDINEFLKYPLITIADFTLTPLKLIGIAAVFVGANLVLLLLNRVLKAFFHRRQIDRGRQFAIQQVVKYILYTVTILLALQASGIQLSLIWGGAAALLVGVGLGLQQTFNDLVSGIIILIEGTVEIGDTVFVDGMVARVKNIGIRTSKVENRDHIVIIIPNSKLVVNNVTNWSSNNAPTRFRVNVGVSYNSDIHLVTRLLLDVASKHPEVLEIPEPSVQFLDFGDSSLNFCLLYFSNKTFSAEAVKSDLRYAIMDSFRENKVEIPFPQRDLWIKNPQDLKASPEQEKELPPAEDEA